MIEVNHITKRFGKVTAVDDFTLDINRGSVLGIVGSNGGGKSTLLRILSGVFDADSGEVKINGQNIISFFILRLIPSPYYRFQNRRIFAQCFSDIFYMRVKHSFINHRVIVPNGCDDFFTGHNAVFIL